MSGVLFNAPRFIPVNASGHPYPAARLYVYQAGSTTLAPAYVDAALNVQSSNPIIANSAGQFPAIYTDPDAGYDYKFVLTNSAGAQLWSEDNVPAAPPLSASVIGRALYPLTDSESAASVTPVNYSSPPGYVSRYGTNTAPGSTDMTDAAQAALSSGHQVVVDGNHKITSPLTATPTAALSITGINGGKFTSSITDNGDYSAVLKITGTSATRLAIRDFEIAHTGTSGLTLYGLQVDVAVASADFENFRVSGARYYGAEVNAIQQTHKNCRYYDNYHAGLTPYGGTIELIGTDCVNNGNGSDNTTGYGVVISGTDARVHGGHFTDNDRYGIDCRYANNAVIDGAYVYNSGYVGIYGVNEDATKDASNIKVLNCTVDMNSRTNSDMAIWLGASGASGTSPVGELLIHNNTIKNTVGNGVVINTGAGSYPPKVISICHNQLFTCGDNGILIDGTSNAKAAIVIGNQLNEANEISVSKCDSATILGNSFTYAGSDTRLIYCAATKAVIKDNVLSGGTNTSSGAIEFTSTSYHIADNHLGSWAKGSSTSYDPVSLNDGAGFTATVTVKGAALGDYADASFSLDLQGITLTAWVSAADTVSVRFQNESTGTLDLGSGTLLASVRKVK